MKRKNDHGFPDRSAIVAFIKANPGKVGTREIAREFGMTENGVKQAFHRLRQRYRQLLREEVAQTVATPAEIEDELRHLIAALRS